MKDQNPSWWTPGHTSAWDRVREALRRDWEQTKQDFAPKIGGDLNQDVDDTLKQAVGKEAIPPANQPNPSYGHHDWADAEAPLGYGYGARLTYGQTHAQWNPELERELERDWSAAPNSGRKPWDTVKHWVRRGYEFTGSH